MGSFQHYFADSWGHRWGNKTNKSWEMPTQLGETFPWIPSFFGSVWNSIYCFTKMLGSYIAVCWRRAIMRFDSSALCCLLSCQSVISDLFEKDWHLLSQFHLAGPGQPNSGRFHWREFNADWTDPPELNEAWPVYTCQLDGSHLGELLFKK